MNSRLLKCVGVAICFTLLAALTRDTLRLVESRVQITCFVAVAAAYEWGVRPHLGRKPSRSGFLFNATLAVAALLAVRWHLEGLCPGYRRIHCTPDIYAGLPYRSDANGRMTRAGIRVAGS
jgi:hypothetical protein